MITMMTRFNYIPMEPRDTSHDEEFSKWSYEKRIRVLSTNKDGTVKDYIEEPFWKEEKCNWNDFIESFNIGSVSEQVINHITKGTPLITAHTLPAGDYTQLEKGAEIKREMADKGITMEMIIDAVKESLNKEETVVSNDDGKGEVNNG